MKLVIEHFPWVTENPYGVYYVLSGTERSLARRFPTEADARAFCEARAAGRKVIAEYPLEEARPDGP